MIGPRGIRQFIAECRTSLAKDGALSDEAPREQKYLGRPPLADLFEGVSVTDKTQRDTVIAAAYLDHGYSMKAIAAHIGVHYITISRAVRKHEERM